MKYNAASLRPSIPRINLNESCGKKFKNCRNLDCKKHVKEEHALYIDYLVEAEAIDLKRRVINDPVHRPSPLNYHERTRHVLPAGSILQTNLNTIENFTLDNQMKINESKSKVMIFNRSRNYDFPNGISKW